MHFLHCHTTDSFQKPVYALTQPHPSPPLPPAPGWLPHHRHHHLPTLLLLLPLHTGSQPPTQSFTSSATGRRERRRAHRPRPARATQPRVEGSRKTHRSARGEWDPSARIGTESGPRVESSSDSYPKSSSAGSESRFHRWHNGLLQRTMHSHLYLHFTAGELTHVLLVVSQVWTLRGNMFMFGRMNHN